MGVPANEPVVHDFSEYDTHVYPVDLYPALRAHVRRAGTAFASREEGDDDEYDGGAERCSLSGAMSAGACDCDNGAVGEGGQGEIGRRRRFRREMQFNLMATFMW